MNDRTILKNQLAQTMTRSSTYIQTLDIPIDIKNVFSNKDRFLQYFLDAGDGWYKAIDDRLAEYIIELFSNKIVTKMLTALMNKSLTIPQILEVCDSPQTSTYRKFNLMINYGIVQRGGFILNGGTRVHSYYSILEGVKLEFNGKMTLFLKMGFWRNLAFR